MKNVLNSDFAEILKDIKEGKVDRIYFINKDEGADDVEFEEVTQSSIAAFAGTDINEVRTAVNTLL